MGWPQRPGAGNLWHMSGSEGGSDSAPVGDDRHDQAAPDLTSGGTWHAPHGWKTRAVAWLILALLAVCLVAVLIFMAVLAFA